jgi:hypothetical protein
MMGFLMRWKPRFVVKLHATPRKIACIRFLTSVDVLMLGQIDFLGELFVTNLALMLFDFKVEGVNMTVDTIFVIIHFITAFPMASEHLLFLRGAWNFLIGWLRHRLMLS